MRERDDSPVKVDARIEAAVLSQLLALHPVQLTFDELMLSIAADPDDFGQYDGVERAVRELRGFGLLIRNDKLILPTWPAVNQYRLLGS